MVPAGGVERDAREVVDPVQRRDRRLVELAGGDHEGAHLCGRQSAHGVCVQPGQATGDDREVGRARGRGRGHVGHIDTPPGHHDTRSGHGRHGVGLPVGTAGGQ